MMQNRTSFKELSGFISRNSRAVSTRILAQRSFGMDYPTFTGYLVYATFVTTILSGFHYAWVWLVREEVELVESSRDDSADR